MYVSLNNLTLFTVYYDFICEMQYIYYVLHWCYLFSGYRVLLGKFIIIYLVIKFIICMKNEDESFLEH